ncbi:MAG: membrane integrity-associated transporter subunit PqiC [Nitrospiraceae bacterium]|nr:MAG: membrane integrity-associated transporter subunit PqiC [Nitrospiraceae bacterium]
MRRLFVNQCIMMNLCLAIIVLGGCTSTSPTRFYTLNPLVNPDETWQSSGKNDRVLGIGPVTLSAYLDRPQIVTGVSENEYAISEFDRWAGNLRDNISFVLAENISHLLGTDEVYVYPWKQTITVDFQVEVNVIRFHGTSDGTVLLSARWSVSEDDGKKALLFRLSNYQEPVHGKGYDALVSAKSRILANFSSDIADAIISETP